MKVLIDKRMREHSPQRVLNYVEYLYFTQLIVVVKMYYMAACHLYYLHCVYLAER